MNAKLSDMQIGKFYDDLSEIWDKTRPGYTEEIFKGIAAHLDKCHSILDFGCGTGLLCRHLRKTFPTARIDGIDISKKMTEKAKANCPDCNFYTGDIFSVRLPRYEAIVSKDVFNHIEDIPGAIKRLDGLLGDKGKLIIANRERGGNVKDSIVDALSQLGYGVSAETHPFKPTEEETESFMKALPAFKEEHKEFIRKKLESGGGYYVLFAGKNRGA